MTYGFDSHTHYHHNNRKANSSGGEFAFFMSYPKHLIFVFPIFAHYSNG